MHRYKFKPSCTTGLALALMLGLCPGLVLAQDSATAAATAPPKPVYRCPGPPVLYTDAILPQEAREQGCKVIESTPVTVVAPAPVAGAANARAARVAPAAAGVSAPSGAASPAGAKAGETKVDVAAQRARDSDARRILGDELRREEERLATLQKEFNNGEPERRGDERNAAKYQDRVAEIKANIARKEVDVSALRRELAKLPP